MPSSDGSLSRTRLARSPLQLILDPDTVGDARHVVEVGHDLDRVRDRGVVQPDRVKRVDVRLLDVGCRVGELDRELAQRPLARRQLGLPPVVRGVSCELSCGALGTEVVGVRLRSVVAVLCGGRDGRE